MGKRRWIRQGEVTVEKLADALAQAVWGMPYDKLGDVFQEDIYDAADAAYDCLYRSRR